MAKKIFGMGNPLLDISCDVDSTVLTRYGLEPANAILAEEKHLPLYEELSKKPDVQYIPGGATLNSIRVARWMLQQSVCSYTGCIGKDAFGDILVQKTEAEGLNVPFMRIESHPTGTCAVLVTGKERSLVANLAAANQFKLDHLLADGAKLAVETADIYYIAGFFLTVSMPAVLHVAKHANDNNKIFCMNLSAPFIIQFFGQQLSEAMPFIDILISNETEAIEYGKVNNLGTEDLGEIAQKIANLPKNNNNRKRIVIFTQGSKPTVLATADSVNQYTVDPIPSEKIIDTNGAGDAFVGGFLSQLALDKPIEVCVKAGNYAAGVIIQHSGCTFPPTPQFIL